LQIHGRILAMDFPERAKKGPNSSTMLSLYFSLWK
jgi:hypothetical protein